MFETIVQCIQKDDLDIDGALKCIFSCEVLIFINFRNYYVFSCKLKTLMNFMSEHPMGASKTKT